MIEAESGSGLQPGSHAWIRSMACTLTGYKVVSVRGRAGQRERSLRLDLECGGALIATQFPSKVHARQASEILVALAQEGVPVPSVMGMCDGLLLQEGVGTVGLPAAMAAADAAGRVKLARAAIDALETWRTAIDRRPDLHAHLPAVGTSAAWLEAFVCGMVFLSNDLRINSPDLDLDALMSALAHPPARFTRWDARMDKAHIRPDGSIIWSDWGQFGLRAGVEDIAWLIADEHWQVGPLATERLMAAVIPNPSLRCLARRMAALVAIDWLATLRQRVLAQGWGFRSQGGVHRQSNLRPSSVTDLCARMAALCENDAVIGGLAPWFVQAGAKVCKLSQTQ